MNSDEATPASRAPSAGPRTRPILIAPDSFKGTFSAEQVAAAIARGAAEAGIPTETCPLADGGEGTMDAVRRARGGEIRRAAVRDPLGRPIEAPFLLLPDGSAFLDSAAATGLPLVEERLRDPIAANSAGTGDLVVAALAAGAEHVFVSAGGSASTDGGRGAIEAIEDSGGLGTTRLTVLCDVQTAYELAASTFAPQKGADPDQVALLSARLDDFATRLPSDPRGMPMTGCAGGLSGGLWASFGAVLMRGTDFLFDVLEIDRALERCQAVITGEGRLDEQSLDGKLIGELARRCTRHDVPLHVVVGQHALDPGAARGAGITSVRRAGSEPELSDAGLQIAREIAALTAF